MSSVLDPISVHYTIDLDLETPKCCPAMEINFIFLLGSYYSMT